MDLEAAQSARAAVEARLSVVKAARNTAQENVERLDLRSPIDGWASQVLVHDGSRTAVGDPMIVLVNTDTLELSATLPAEMLAQVRPGTLLRFHLDAFPGEEFEGRIDRLSPTTEPGTRQVRIYTRVPNPGGRLLGGLYAGGRIVVFLGALLAALVLGMGAGRALRLLGQTFRQLVPSMLAISFMVGLA